MLKKREKLTAENIVVALFVESYAGRMRFSYVGRLNAESAAGFFAGKECGTTASLVNEL